MYPSLSISLDSVKSSWHRPLLSPGERQSAMQDTSWADGLRGIAALFVVSSHIVLCFARRLVLPCCGAIEGRMTLFQRPIFRLLAQGHSWVAIFFILSGFVNALKPIKLARSGNVETALSNMALSSFRRTFRLMLPAAAATILSWVICQMGMYETARNGDAYWLYTYTPGMSYSWGTALEDLVNALRATWTLGVINVYDQPQWALIYLLMGSMMVFCALLMTVNLRSGWRMATLGVFALWSFDWSFKNRDPLVGFTVLFGIVLAEMSLSELPQNLSTISPLLTPLLAILGLVLMSFPSDRPHLAGWSSFLNNIGKGLFPTQGDLGRTWGSVGGLILVFSILISPHARRLLSRRPLLWLGKVSFPIYLLHGTFMRTLMAWFVFAGQTPVPFEVGNGEEKHSVLRYPQPGSLRIVVAIAFSMGAMLVTAHFWAKKVEPVFGKITRAAEDLMFGRGDGVVAANGNGSVLPLRKE